MKLSTWLLLFTLNSWLLSSCANISTPTGGPKDTLPPTLVESNPEMGAVNVNPQSVKLEFSEYIQQRNLQQQLIVSPLTEDFRFKTKLNKETLELVFEKPLEPNTTYTFNFGNAIGDITENNPAENLTLAFSTGPTIDSISLNGTVVNIQTGKGVDKAIVGLYPATDTANILTRKPYYLTRTNEQGQYQFNYLKPGTYKLYAGADANQNLKIESRSEAFGFKANPLDLSSSIDSVQIALVRVNADSLLMNSARASGRYYEITYNKPLFGYTLYPDDQIEALEVPPNNLVNENKTIRFYPQAITGDSIRISVAAKDSLEVIRTDTVYLRFEESERKADAFAMTAKPPAGSTVDENFNLQLFFSKPVKQIKQDSLYIAYDSLRQESINVPEEAWNDKRTELNLSLQVPKPSYPDSVPVRSRISTFSLVVGQQAIISAENDTLDQQELSYTWLDVSQTGSISGSLLTSSSRNLILELIKGDNYAEPVRTSYGTASFSFRKLPPGEYTMRVIRDQNGNYRWDPGNLYGEREPEPIYIVPTPITIKANWEVNDVEIALPEGV